MNEDNDSDDEGPKPRGRRPNKMQKTSNDKRSVPSKVYLDHTEPEMTEEERQKILQFVEQEELTGEILDEAELRRMILLFEKRNLRNQEMRIKFPENPEKFMESEIALHGMIEQLKLVATVPDLYSIFVDLRTIPSLLELLSHQNTGTNVELLLTH